MDDTRVRWIKAGHIRLNVDHVVGYWEGPHGLHIAVRGQTGAINVTTDWEETARALDTVLGFKG